MGMLQGAMLRPPLPQTARCGAKDPTTWHFSPSFLTSKGTGSLITNPKHNHSLRVGDTQLEREKNEFLELVPRMKVIRESLTKSLDAFGTMEDK